MTETRVAIFGAGGFGREVHGYLLELQAAGAPITIAGFIDSNPTALDPFSLAGDPQILGDSPAAAVGACDAVVIALGAPELRASVRKLASTAGLPLYTVKHPLAWVAATAQVGAGSILAPFVVVNDHAVVAENVALNSYASVAHDARVDIDAVLSPYATLTGAATLGTQCMMGTQTVLRPGVSVGRNSKIAAGSIVAHDAPAGSLVAGAPAKNRPKYDVPDEA